MERTLLAVASASDPRRRIQLLDDLQGPAESRRHLRLALLDLSNALGRAPLSPRTHVMACSLAPLTGMPAEPWIRDVASLNQNSAELSYLNGWFAFHLNDSETAIDQWSKSVSIGHEYLGSIYRLAQSKIPRHRVARDLVPASRPDLLIRLVAAARADQPSDHAAALADALIRDLEANEALDPGIRHATVARMQSLVAEFDTAYESWQRALAEMPRDPDYRLEYSRVLSKLGRNQEALDQAVLAQTLNPTDERLAHWCRKVRAEIRGPPRSATR